MLVQCSLLSQNALRKIRLAAVGGKFTFTICSYFRRIGIVVPLYSHAIKSTPTPSKYQKSFDPSLRTKLNYPLPKLSSKTTTK